MQESLRFMLVLEADNGGVRVTDDDHLAGRLAAPAMGPGRLSRGTTPTSTGSMPLTKTIGVVGPAATAAGSATVLVITISGDAVGGQAIDKN
jgi:hypothetical protein